MQIILSSNLLTDPVLTRLVTEANAQASKLDAVATEAAKTDITKAPWVPCEVITYGCEIPWHFNDALPISQEGEYVAHCNATIVSILDELAKIAASMPIKFIPIGEPIVSFSLDETRFKLTAVGCLRYR